MPRRTRFSLAIPLAVLLGAVSPPGASSPSPPAEPKKAGDVLQTEDTNVAGISAEFVECRVKDGVLGVKVRLRNTGNERVEVRIISNRDFDKYYATAGAKKYLVLRDSEGVPLAPATDGFGNLGVTIEKGGSWTWWAKYPGPPASEKKITYVWPLGPPIEDVPISR